MKFLLAHPHAAVFILAFFLADILTPVARHLAWLTGILDQPSERKIHKEPTALLGGVPIFIAYLFSTLSTLEFSETLIVVLSATGILFVIGLIDDIVHLPATAKLMALFFLSLGLYHFGIVIQFFPFVIDVAVTLLWFAYVSSCFNAIDNMDGLCAGSAAIAAFFFYLISYETDQPYMGYLAIALSGACIGFLRYNLILTKIFLGDSGAFFIGFTLAAIAVMGYWGTSDSETWKAVVVPISILFVPLYDLFITTLLRIRNGTVKTLKEAVMLSAKDHLSHRIMQTFHFSPLRTVLVLYLCSAVWGVTGMLARILPFPLALSLIGLVASLTIGLTLKIKDTPVSYP